MSLSAGTKLGPYEIQALRGAGGMGDVFRARDTRLERTVAIKVLPQHLSTNPESKQRFEREARTISSLNHPHICALYDIGTQDGVDFLVMEYLEGQTLAERLQKGALPIEQVLKIGIEIADALDKAHQRGIVHRDLKPGNIMLTKSGAKLMDFGLAKPAKAAFIAGAAVGTPTLSNRLTVEGTIVGTFQYMAPEQLEGKEADVRSDIFAFGALLYEMVTGKPAFTGKTPASIIAAILSSDPLPLAALQPETPFALDQIIRVSLAKDPEERWQSSRDVRRQLEWVAQSAVAASQRALGGRGRVYALGWVIAVGLAVLLAVLGLQLRGKAPAPTMRVTLLPPDRYSFDPFDVAISPDGSQVAFVAGTRGAPKELWIRRLEFLSAQPLAGTDGASLPFWSPDGKHLGFFADGKLKRIDANGGPANTLADAPIPRGGSWGSLGLILFVPDELGVVYSIPARGGSATAVTRFETARQELTHRWPMFLSDGRHFIYLARGVGGSPAAERAESGILSGIFMSSADSSERKLLLATGRRAVWSNGYLLFMSGGRLLAQCLDEVRFALIGRPIPVAQNVQVDDRWSDAVSASDDGKLLIATGAGPLELNWFSRSGKRIQTIAKTNFNVPRLSHNGQSIASSVFDPDGSQDIFIYGVNSGAESRFTFDPGTEDDPVWSPDGSTIAFDSSRQGQIDLYQKPADGSRNEELLFADKTTKFPTSWSADGKYLLFDRLPPGRAGRGEIWVLPLFGDRTPFAFAAAGFDQRFGEFLPDGKWVAYVSSESGIANINVAPFHPSGIRYQVSSKGGLCPKWRNDGKELFYIDGAKQIIAVDVIVRSSSLRIGEHRALFQARVGDGPAYSLNVTKDGNHFLVLERPEQASSNLTLVLNWQRALVEQ